MAATGTWGGFNGVGTRDWDTGSVTWRDYWLISGRKADHLECVPVCIYQCHYTRVLQCFSLQARMNVCIYVSMSLCPYVAIVLCISYVSVRVTFWRSKRSTFRRSKRSTFRRSKRTPDQMGHPLLGETYPLVN